MLYCFKLEVSDGLAVSYELLSVISLDIKTMVGPGPPDSTLEINKC